MARYLRAAGWDVRVLASDAFGALPEDASTGVVRVRDLKSAGVLRRVLRREELAPPGAGAHAEPPAPALLTKVLVPDAHVASWLPWAVLAARRERFDCLVTTGPPDSAHLVGLALRRSAWVADFRDGWTYEPLREPFPTGAQRRLDAALEARVVRGADRVVAVTEAIADDFRRRLAADVAMVPNGYDPALDAEAAQSRPIALPDDRLALVHTGALSGLRGRDPAPLLDALARLEPDAARRLVLVQAGPHTDEDERRLAGLRERGLAITLGSLPRPHALALQRRAAALVLITSDEVSQATGKLYEYLAAGRPIVALAKGNEAARIVETTGTGLTVAPADEDAIAGALRRVVTGELARQYAPRDVERYRYPRPAEEMAAILEAAIARRRRAPSHRDRR
jgi:glycosyltransferase involved in cell wall biosynthesis